jgi:hypothetical protein
LKGHDGPVLRCVALSEKKVLSCSEDGTIRVWDLVTKRQLRALLGHTGAVTDATLIQDGRIVSSSADRSLRVWNLQSCVCEIALLDAHDGVIHGVRSLPSGNVASFGSDGTVRIWNLNTRECVHKIELSGGAVCKMALLPDGRIACPDDQQLYIYNAELGTGETLRVGTSNVSGITALPDGRLLLAVGADNTFRIVVSRSGSSTAPATAKLPINTEAMWDEGKVGNDTALAVLMGYKDMILPARRAMSTNSGVLPHPVAAHAQVNWNALLTRELGANNPALVRSRLSSSDGFAQGHAAKDNSKIRSRRAGSAALNRSRALSSSASASKLPRLVPLPAASSSRPKLTIPKSRSVSNLFVSFGAHSSASTAAARSTLVAPRPMSPSRGSPARPAPPAGRTLPF